MVASRFQCRRMSHADPALLDGSVEQDPSHRNNRLGRPFWTLVTSSGLSNLADGVFKLALPLVAIHYTRSPALVAGLELVRTLPWLIGSLQVGALTDRLDRRRIMVWANTARAVFVAVPAVAITADGGSLWLLYVAAVGTGMAEVFYDTAAQSILPSLVPRSRLDRANGRLYAVELGAQEFAGPPLAGALVAIALALSFATSAALWAVALVALLAVRGTFRPQRHGPRTTIRSDIRQGISFLINRPVLRTMALMVGMTNLATSAVFAVLVLFAVGPDSALGLTEPQFGILFAVLAAGAVVGGLVAARVQRRIGRARALTLSVVGAIAYVATPALTTNVAIIAAVMFTGGLTTMLWNVATVSFRQRATPDHLLGRVNTTYRLVAWGTRPLGAALGGALGEWFGVRSVFALMGLVTVAVLIPNRRITEQALTDAERI
jgi:MFS family permease